MGGGGGVTEGRGSEHAVSDPACVWCVVLYSFARHVISSHSGDFVTHGVTDHGSQRMRVMLQSATPMGKLSLYRSGSQT